MMFLVYRVRLKVSIMPSVDIMASLALHVFEKLEWFLITITRGLLQHTTFHIAKHALNTQLSIHQC